MLGSAGGGGGGGSSEDPSFDIDELQVMRSTIHLSLKPLVEEVDWVLVKTHLTFLQLSAINYGTLRQNCWVYACPTQAYPSGQVLEQQTFCILP